MVIKTYDMIIKQKKIVVAKILLTMRQIYIYTDPGKKGDIIIPP